jgi:hypothetical protein
VIIQRSCLSLPIEKPWQPLDSTKIDTYAILHAYLAIMVVFIRGYYDCIVCLCGNHHHHHRSASLVRLTTMNDQPDPHWRAPGDTLILESD